MTCITKHSIWDTFMQYNGFLYIFVLVSTLKRSGNEVRNYNLIRSQAKKLNFCHNENEYVNI